ncbi:MAG: indole-3-glycerol-phosphate synthase [Deltaproteobacteria bacterium]|jgi:indole-3-glycerol phosphate synthase|nr:indole-3-glycerol-phosphate synthase [Deltaproteobacteria bacterium]
MELARFRAAKEAEIQGLKLNPPPKAPKIKRPDFLAGLTKGVALRGLGLIAEYKRASPSLGDLDLSLTPKEAATAYAAAEAISVLTEATYFKGDPRFLNELAVSDKPLLRKDFIFEPLQVLETALFPASAILLIVRLTPDLALLKDLIALALDQGLAPVVEVFNQKELAIARKAEATIIQVNARDLETLTLDKAGHLRLIKKDPPQDGEFWIAASGLATAQDLAARRAAGYGAVLIGSALMGSGSPGQALTKILAELKASDE